MTHKIIVDESLLEAVLTTISRVREVFGEAEEYGLETEEAAALCDLYFKFEDIEYVISRSKSDAQAVKDGRQE